MILESDKSVAPVKSYNCSNTTTLETNNSRKTHLKLLMQLNENVFLETVITFDRKRIRTEIKHEPIANIMGMNIKL